MTHLIQNLLKLVLLVGVVHSQNVIPPQIQLEIDTLLESWIADNNIPGLGLAITRGDGELVYSRGYGFRDVENRLIADSNTLFGIGSITKSFTAIVVIKKLNEMFPQMGVTVLDTPIRTLAPSYNFILGDRYRSESTTFRDLLSHKVCTLPETIGMWVSAYSDSDEFYFRHRFSPELCSFRNGLLYNNGLIGMAGDVIGHMANSTFNNLLGELLIGIGMNSSTWVKQTDDHNNMFGRSVPYIYKDGALIRYNTELLKTVVVANAAGGILSNPNDMMKYMQFHLNQGRVGGVQLVPETVMAWLSSPSNPSVGGVLKTGQNPNATINMNLAYGLGMVVGVYDGWLKVWHNGYIPPYESEMHLYPNLNLGIFTTISGPGTTDYASKPTPLIHNEIFHILQGGTVNNVKSFAPFSSSRTVGPLPVLNSKKMVTEIKIDPEQAVGTFGSGLNGEMNLTMQTNPDGVQQLYMEYGVWGRGWLTQISNATFNIEWDSDFWMLLWTNTIGLVNTTLSFLDVNTLQLDSGATNFERGLRLDDLPEIPYSPGSCGPEIRIK